MSTIVRFNVSIPSADKCTPAMNRDLTNFIYDKLQSTIGCKTEDIKITSKMGNRKFTDCTGAIMYILSRLGNMDGGRITGLRVVHPHSIYAVVSYGNEFILENKQKK